MDIFTTNSLLRLSTTNSNFQPTNINKSLPRLPIVFKQLKYMLGKLENVINNNNTNPKKLRIYHEFVNVSSQLTLNMLNECIPSKEKKTFISYAQGQTPNEPFEIIKHNPEAFFRDSDDLQDVQLLPMDVGNAKFLIMLLASYSPSDLETNPLRKYGLLSRLYCLVELVSAIRYKIPIIPVEVIKPGCSLMIAPTTLQETQNLLKPDDWIILEQVTGCQNGVQAVFNAVLQVEKLRKSSHSIKWKSSSHDSVVFERGLKQLFNKIDVEYSTANESPIPSSISSFKLIPIASVIYGPDAETEAVQFVHEANKTFPESGGLLLAKTMNKSMEEIIELTNTTMIWLTPGLCRNEQAMKAVIKAQQLNKSIVSIKVKDFDFQIPVVEVIPGTKDALLKLFPFIAKPLDGLASLATIKVQTRAIWSVLGLDASSKDEMLKDVPDVGDKYQIAVQKHLDFVEGTRDWVFIQIDEWIKNMMASKSPGAFAIVGVGGMGKSVMAGVLAFRGSTIIRRLCNTSNDDVDLPYNVVALHFFKHDDKGKNDPRSAIGSLSRQLANNVNGFRIALQESLDKIVDKSKEFSDLETLFLKSVVEPAIAVTEPEVEPKLMIIDALDECGTSGSKEKEQFLKVITKLWPKMPFNYGLILTSRPEDGVTSNDLFHVEFLKQTEEHNKQDLKAYVRTKLVDELFISTLDAVKVSELVAERADGLFIFARLVIGKLLDLAKDYKLNDEKLSLKDAETLPKGMDDLYVDYFSRFKASIGGDGNKYARILSPIVVAREPMPLNVWREVVLGNNNNRSSSNMSEAELERQFTIEVLIPTAKLLDTSNGTVKVLHKTMLDFLIGTKAKSNGLGINEDEGHALLGGACERLYQDYLDKDGGKGRICTPINSTEYQFAVQHAAFHSMKGNIDDYGVKWFIELERIFHWLNGGIQNDNSRFTTMLGDGDIVLKKLNSSNSNGEQLAKDTCKLMVDVLRLSRKALLVDPRMLGCEILGRVISTEWEDGTTAQERVNLRLQAEQFIERIRQEEKIKIAVPIGQLSGMDEAGTSLKVVWHGHESRVCCVSYSKDGTKVVSGSKDNTVRVWDSVNGKELKKFSGHELSVNAVCFSPDGLHIASGSADESILLWNAETDKLLKKLQGHSGTVYSVCYSPDGTLIASGSFDKTIRIWGSKSGKELKILEGHSHSVRLVCFSPTNNNQLASASFDKTVRVWDVANGQELKLFKGHSEGVFGVCYSPDGSLIASGSRDKTIIIWNSTTGDIVVILKDHSREINSVCFSPDGTTIVSGSDDKTIRVWESNTGKLIKVFDYSSELLSVCFSVDGTCIICGSWDNMICVVDASYCEKLKQPIKGHLENVSCICLSQDGTLVASGSGDETICIWESSSGKQKWKLEGHEDKINSISFSFNGTIFASGSWDKTVRIWDIKIGKCLNVLQGHTKWVNSVCFSPNGLEVASCSDDRTIRVWDIKSGQQIKLLQGHSDWVKCICYSPDGMKIASGSGDETVRIWDCNSGEELMKLEGLLGSLHKVCFSSEGKKLVSGSNDKTVKIWDLTTGQMLKSFENSYNAEFSPDGLYLISSNSGRCWDANSFEPVDNVLSRIDTTAISNNFISCCLPINTNLVAFTENNHVGFMIPPSSRLWITTYIKTTKSWIACGYRGNLICIYEWR
jgi:WD40 repeat protein